MDRANAALEAAQKAFTDLRNELQKGGSRLLKDAQLRNTEKLLKDAGKTYRTVSKRLLKDLEDLQKAATTGKRPASRKGTTKTTTKAKATARKTATKARSTAKSGAKRTTAAAKKRAR